MRGTLRPAWHDIARAYAERIGVNENTVKTWKYAADVAVLGAQHFSSADRCLPQDLAFFVKPNPSE